MAGQLVANQSTSSCDFEIVESDSDNFRTVSHNQISLWIDPGTIKLRHRLKRGPFGDVWLATHQATEDSGEYHEVAVKVLHPFKEDILEAVLSKLNNLISKCQGLDGVCCLLGISFISGKICIVMKFYEGSISDKMDLLKGGKLSLFNILRYGIDLAQGIMRLHSRDIIVLNLKPSNFLLNEDDRAVVGDIGILYVLLGIPLPSSDMTRRFGTPNYMAPEQWQPEVRGPILFKTDSWAFACSIVEMLTGSQPWSGKSVDEIYNLVVRKQEKPHVPVGLPPVLENVIIGCFTYDLRSRPPMEAILNAFKSAQNTVRQDGCWTDLGSQVLPEKSGYIEWDFLKDDFQVSDKVRSRKPSNFCKPQNMNIPEGIVVGLEDSNDQNRFLLVKVHGTHNPIRVPRFTLERLTFGLVEGDWVRLKKEDKKHSPVGILHSVCRDGNVTVGFIGLESTWKGNCSELQMAEAHYVGQFVRLKSNVFSPRFEWPRKRGGEWGSGRICQVLPNGCLIVKFPGRLTIGDENSSFMADPSEVEVVSFNTCPGLIKKYEHLEDFHWAVRPLLIALGLFTAAKLGFCVGKKLVRPKVKNEKNSVIQGDVQMAGNTAWFPPKVGNIIFR